MAVDARASRSRRSLRRPLLLGLGLPILALAVCAMFLHSVLTSALTPARPAVVAGAPAAVREPAGGALNAAPAEVWVDPADGRQTSRGTRAAADREVPTNPLPVVGRQPSSSAVPAVTHPVTGTRPAAVGQRAPPATSG